jgi:hypothetical protein
MKSVVATGRRMKRRDGFIGRETHSAARLAIQTTSDRSSRGGLVPRRLATGSLSWKEKVGV